MTQTPTQPAPEESVDSLFDHLGQEADERAVYSAIYGVDGEGGLGLRYASLLIGPAAMSEGSWAAWMLTGARHLTERFQDLANVPAEGLLDSTPVLEGGALVGARFAMDVAAARTWLAQALAGELLPAVGDLGAASATLLAPTAPLHLFPRLWSPVSRLAASTVRPQRGFFFPLADQPDPPVLRAWKVGGVSAHDGSWSTLGIALPLEGQRTKPPPAGLLVARLERRAWFNDVRGDGNFNRFELHVGIEPERIDISELEVELEEWDGEELVNSRRLALGDLKLGQRAGKDRFLVGLPTLGRGFAHEARLYDREGALLDRTQRSRLVERIEAKARYGGPGGAVANQKFTIGERVEAALLERLARFDQLDEDYRQMLSAGLEERIISGPGRANVLGDELARVTRPLAILDPYFGYQASDWQALSTVATPIRILTGAKAKPVPAALTNVEVRRWRGPAKNPPFHDRFYLWEGGGLTVGTSPSGLGSRDARLDRIGATEAAAWMASFETYWLSADFGP
jgi:hypothetical protein